MSVRFIWVNGLSELVCWALRRFVPGRGSPGGPGVTADDVKAGELDDTGYREKAEHGQHFSSGHGQALSVVSGVSVVAIGLRPPGWPDVGTPGCLGL